ncbi:MAG: HAMP domain-containing sensor histidine kinase [Schaedlerella sp.]|nr:HAMP domain-containing sensor histidine kinase [Schaedlerella sp.]
MKISTIYFKKSTISFFKKCLFICSLLVLLFYIYILYKQVIYQNVVIIGMFSEQLSASDTQFCINNIFSSTHDTEAYHNGLSVMQQTGYTNTYYKFLTHNFIYITLFFLIAIIFLLFIFWSIRRLENHLIKKETNTINSWILDNTQELPIVEYNFESIVYSISLLKEKLQKQERLHKEDTERVMHYMENISHQLKTPLTVINVVCEKFELQHPDFSVPMNKCLQQVNKMSNLIHDLLQLGKFDCRKINMKFESVLAQNLIENVVNDLDPLAFQKNITILTSGKSDILWFCDVFWIKEVIGNILKNCIEHSKDGEITLLYTETNKTNHILIQDCGTGFSKDQENTIFDRYSLEDRDHSEGTGLGMAIAKQAIQLHFGSIKAQNRLEGGAEFLIMFPKLDAADLYKK